MAQLRRGSTPTNVFDVNIDLTGAKIYITYKQGNKIIVEKTGADIQVEQNRLTTRLTQEETLRFAPGPAGDSHAFNPVVVNIGGGTSDFETFTVTFDLTVQEGSKDIGAARISGAFMPYPAGEYPYTADQIELSEQEGSTDLKAELAAYQGYAYFGDIVIEDADGTAMEFVSDPTLSGGVSETTQGHYVVTGDGTISGVVRTEESPK